MNARLTVLENIRVASPCTASWQHMSGDRKTRFCHQCKLHVHDLSAMTQAEVLSLIEQAERSGSRICGRFYLRRDGSVLTRDCPVGLAALRRRLARFAGSIAAAVLCGAGAIAFLRWSPSRTGGGGGGGGSTTSTRVSPGGGVPVLMGEISWTPPAGTSTPTR